MKGVQFAVRRGLLAALVGLPWATRAAVAAQAILGTWLTDDGASKVEVTAAKLGDGSTVYSGRIVWLKEPLGDGQPLQDRNNVDAAQRGRPILGLVVLSGFKADGDGWRGGTVYSPRVGKAYPADLAITADGRLELKVKAGLLTKTDYWTR